MSRNDKQAPIDVQRALQKVRGCFLSSRGLCFLGRTCQQAQTNYNHCAEIFPLARPLSNVLSLLYLFADRLRHCIRRKRWSADLATGRRGEDLASRRALPDRAARPLLDFVDRAQELGELRVGLAQNAHAAKIADIAVVIPA